MNIGIIGESEGNGHPYSWSAIINGFDYKFLNEIPFPAIKKYLTNKDSNKVLNQSVKVTKVFCKNIEYAKKVAQFSKINEVCKTLDGFTDNLDAIIIAKDDYENHIRLIEVFSQFKLPILIDKPIAINISSLNKILRLEKYENQFFSCSGMYFSPEINLFPKSLNKINKIKAETHGPWDRYSIHMINPLEKFFTKNGMELFNFLDFDREVDDQRVNLKLKYSDFIVELISDSKQVFGVTFTFEYKSGAAFTIELSNTYKAFSDMLNCFFDQIKYNKINFTKKDLENTIKIIELGVGH